MITHSDKTTTSNPARVNESLQRRYESEAHARGKYSEHHTNDDSTQSRRHHMPTRICTDSDQSSIDQFNICSWNIHGLDNLKINQLNKYLTKFDILMFNETWSTGFDNYHIDSFTLIIDGYRKYKHPLSIRNSGGIAVFVRENIKEGVKVHSVYKDIIAWLLIDKGYFGIECDIYIGCVYFPPEGSTCIEDDMFSILQGQIAKFDPNAKIIIAGDINSRISTKNDIEVTYEGSDCAILNNDQYFSHQDADFINYLKTTNCYSRSTMDVGPVNEHGRELIRMCKATKLIIVNGRIGSDKHTGRYSRIDTTGCSLVDYVLVSPNVFRLITNFEIGDKFPESDHLPLKIGISIVKKPNQSDSGKMEPKISHWNPTSKYVWHESKLSDLVLLLEDDISKHYYQEFLSEMIQLGNAENVAGLFHAYIQQACDRLFKKRHVRPQRGSKKPSWYDKNCHELRHIAITAGERIDNEHERNLCIEACKNYRSYKQRMRRSYYHDCLKKIESTYIHDRSNLWNVLSELSPNLNAEIIPDKNEFYTYYKSHSEARINPFFDYQYEKYACEYIRNKHIATAVSYTDPKLMILNCNFTEEEILACINSLKNRKSAGIDCIPAEFVKRNGNYMVKDITLLFNYFIEIKDFPDQWSEGIRNPIHKSGSKLNPNNYRGITVLPVFEKIFEMAVHRRIEFLDDAFNLDDRYNLGFKKGCSTVDNLSILQGIIERQLILNQNVIVCLVDFSKAFDMINRNILFYKLNKLGLKGRVIDTLHSLYNKTSFRVKLKGQCSDLIHESIGVNQGGNASPILFKKYLQDLIDYLNAYTGVCTSNEILHHILWADDLILVSTLPKHAQVQLNGLKGFCKPNQMVVNEIKTKFMIFGKAIDTKLYYNDKEIERVNSYKCLGIVINSTTNPRGNMYRLHPEYLCEQARKGFFNILRRTKSIGEIPPKHMLYLYESMIQPILTYGSEVWGHNKNACETVDKFYFWVARNILRVKASTCNIITLGECGLIPPSIYCHIRLILHAIRLINLHDGSVLKSVFNDTLCFHEMGFKNWIAHVRTIADIYGIDLNKYTYSETTKKRIKSLIKNKFISRWQSDLNNTDKYPILRTYRLFKQNFCFEPHLTHIKNACHRSALNKLRCSSHLLAIERGRHTKPKTPIENRLCFHCNTIEDEIHFLTNCGIYERDRQIFFNSVSSKFPNFSHLNSEHKFVFLLSCEDNQITTHLGKFIYTALQDREDFLKTLSSS